MQPECSSSLTDPPSALCGRRRLVRSSFLTSTSCAHCEARPDCAGQSESKRCASGPRRSRSDLAKKVRFWEPPPLRDGLHPLDLPRIDPNSLDGQKLASANCLYQFAHLALRNPFPSPSWFWGVLAFLVRERGHKAFQTWFNALTKVVYDQCEHGGQRPKATRPLCHPGHAFQALTKRCSKNHNYLVSGLQWLQWTEPRVGSLPSLVPEYSAHASCR